MTIDRPHWVHWMPHPELSESGEPYRRRWLALIVLSVSVLLIAIDMTIVGIAAPSISKGLGASSTQIQWSFDAYTVTMAGFVVLCGGLAERYGRKRVLLIGVTTFAAGSSLSAFAGSPTILIAGRIVSGIGAAMMFPAALSQISALFGPDERHRAVSIFAAFSAIGLAAGPLVGGLLLDRFWFGSAFLVVVPVAVLAWIAIAAIIPPSRDPERDSLDPFGALLSVLGLSGLVFGVIEGPDRGWADPMVLLPIAIGALITCAFIAWELRVERPLFDLRVLANGRVISGALALAMVYFTFSGIQLLVPQYLRYVKDLTSIQAGLVMIPPGIGLMLLSPHSGACDERFGRRPMLTFCLICMTVGMAILALIDTWGGIVNVLLGFVIYGVGFGLIVAPATSTVMLAVPKGKIGDGSAVNLLARQVGGAIGVAVVGSLASAIYRARVPLDVVPLSPEQAGRVEDSLSGALALGSELAPDVAARLDAAADAAMTTGVAWSMGVTAALTAGAAMVAWIALRERPQPGSAAS